MTMLRYAGVSIATLGLILALTGYYILASIAVAAIGLGFLLVGILTVAVSHPSVNGGGEYESVRSNGFMKLYTNILEELSVSRNPIFLPSDEGPITLVPIQGLDHDIGVEKIPRRVFLKIRDGYALALPIIDGQSYPDMPRDATLDGVESYLTSQFIARFDILRKIRVVEDTEANIIVDIEGLNKRYREDLSRYGYITILVGSVLAEAIASPIELLDVSLKGGKGRLIFRRY
jgi:hypothetical protein